MRILLITLAALAVSACTITVNINGTPVVDIGPAPTITATVTPTQMPTQTVTPSPTPTPEPTPTRERLTPLLVISQSNIRSCPQFECAVVFVADAGSQLTGVGLVSGAEFARSTQWWQLIDGLFIHTVLVQEE